jgi:hypothetical protein
MPKSVQYDTGCRRFVYKVDTFAVASQSGCDDKFTEMKTKTYALLISWPNTYR